MKIQLIAGIILIIAGTFGLAYGGFNYTRETHTAEIGPMSMSLDDREHMNIPVWAGISLIIGGGIVLAWRRET